MAFASDYLKRAFLELQAGKFEDKRLAKNIEAAICELKENPFAGVAIPRRLWPKEYVCEFQIDNLRKLNLPSAWRLTYTIRGNELEIISVILEWFDHKSYEKRFGYATK